MAMKECQQINPRAENMRSRTAMTPFAVIIVVVKVEQCRIQWRERKTILSEFCVCGIRVPIPDGQMGLVCLSVGVRVRDNE